MDSKEIVFQVNIETDFLSATEREHFEERAAIMEYDAGLEREQAEQFAFQLLMSKRDIYQKAV